MPVVINGDTGITQSGEFNSDSTMGFKNRIINGDMRIDQRNSGASVTPTATVFTLDRWQATVSASSKFSVQQNAGSVTPPAGFKNYLGCTSLSAYSLGAGDYFMMRQAVEGFNTSDLAWGTASASQITISFWVRSSLTGTFGGALENNASNRSYPFTYTISAANTWEQKSITIAGDTTGTWATDNTIGIMVAFSLGAGSTYSGTAGSWSSTRYFSATGAVSVVGTNGATFYITGVQLEKGSTATSFDFRSYGTELALCQRYYEKSFNESTAPAQNVSSSGAYSTMQVVGQGTTQYAGSVKFSVSKRVAPTVTLFGTQAANAEFYNVNTGTSCSASGTQSIGTNAFQTFATTPVGAGGAGNGLFVQWTASSEL